MKTEGADILSEIPAATEPPAPRAARRQRHRLEWLKTFTPVVTAAVALAVHRGMANHQNATPSGIYARLLIGVMIFFALVGVTQRLWHRVTPTWRNFLVAGVF